MISPSDIESFGLQILDCSQVVCDLQLVLCTHKCLDWSVVMPHGRSAKRRRLTPPVDDSIPSKTVQASDLFSHAADWDLEEEYEQRQRKKKTTESTRLPTKTAEGAVKHVEALPHANDADSFLGSDSEGDVEEENGLATPPTDLETTPQIPIRQQVLEAKEELARIAGLLNEDPEEHAGSFKRLAQVGELKAPVAVQKLVLATQVAVYKDVIPGYRIRAYQEDVDMSTKVSKDVRVQRQYEHALVTNYQTFVKRLAFLAKARGTGDEEASLRSVAISCACSLLLAVPHFNFRTELLNILISVMAGREATPEYIKCVKTFETFFEADDDGAPSMEAVSLLTKTMKAKDFRVREEVLNTFFRLRLLSELAPESSEPRSGRSGDVSRLHGRRLKKEKWEHRSKKEKKLAKERKVVEKDMAEADASVNYEERDKMQSETLKMVFTTYFRILKARVPSLMGAVLEGLAKYAHLINQDYFGDILEALKDIVNQAHDATEEEGEEEEASDMPDQRNSSRESLLSTQTAFTLLSQQDVAKSASGLQLDLSFFSSNTYRILYPLALDSDIELGPKSFHLPDPHTGQRNKVNVSTPILLLTRVLNSILLTPSQPPPTVTAAAFYKRLLTTCLDLPEKSLLAILHLMTKIADKHGRKIEALWYSDERKGDGVFRGDSDSVEGTNVLAVGSGIWEEELLRKHYCPKVRDSVIGIDKVIAGLAKQ